MTLVRTLYIGKLYFPVDEVNRGYNYALMLILSKDTYQELFQYTFDTEGHSYSGTNH